ncbi:flagellar basal body rod protein FlgB [Alloacidobacterium dinghuense]|uniref:Flagellar basal body rod protein FlgB n=1 Tax=Alloacidobacterium dinghuense TaxID=2763107 RepID=A0A7G8BNP8_9BACT|nr:flagellar basal body rod protein FlgB [Alloacidobacterium dinghuense]QNI34168.1 flagellar basal body rod protein FlgB [Alloacidobacterium dinghuense]
MQISTPMSDALERYLDLSSQELKLTAQNMANIDTPGYRAQGFDFAGEMKRSLGELAAGQTKNGVARKPFSLSAPRVGLVDGLVERPDGNNVSMDRESLNMAEAQLQFRTGVELLKRESTRVMDAIHADSK